MVSVVVGVVCSSSIGIVLEIAVSCMFKGTAAEAVFSPRCVVVEGVERVTEKDGGDDADAIIGSLAIVMAMSSFGIFEACTIGGVGAGWAIKFGSD